MSVFDDGKGFVGNSDRLGNIFVGQREINKMVVMIGEVYPTLDALGYPLLMEHERRIIGNAEIEQSRLAGHHQIKSVVGSGGMESICQLGANAAEQNKLARAVVAFPAPILPISFNTS